MQRVETSAQRTYQLDGKVIAAFAAIYIVWGSTFLAIRYAVESIPPFLLIGLRSGGAGVLLYAWVWLRGEQRPRWEHWRSAAISGFCFFVLCHGCLAWAEQHVPSGVAAVVMALIPIWVVLLDWVRPGGARPGRAVLVGVVVGFVGLVLLVGPDVLRSGASADVVATLALALSALAWAAGTIYNRYTAHDIAPTTMSAMQLLVGGGMLLMVGSATGEWNTLLAGSIQTRAVLALVYLIIVGSLLTFSAYIWLLRVYSPARVATYAYVNPIVAVLLGWAVAGEVLTLPMLLAMGLIVLAVVIIIQSNARRN